MIWVPQMTLEIHFDRKSGRFVINGKSFTPKEAAVYLFQRLEEILRQETIISKIINEDILYINQDHIFNREYIQLLVKLLDELKGSWKVMDFRIVGGKKDYLVHTDNPKFLVRAILEDAVRRKINIIWKILNLNALNIIERLLEFLGDEWKTWGIRLNNATVDVLNKYLRFIDRFREKFSPRNTMEIIRFAVEYRKPEIIEKLADAKLVSGIECSGFDEGKKVNDLRMIPRVICAVCKHYPELKEVLSDNVVSAISWRIPCRVIRESGPFAEEVAILWGLFGLEEDRARMYVLERHSGRSVGDAILYVIYSTIKKGLRKGLSTFDFKFFKEVVKKAVGRLKVLCDVYDTKEARKYDIRTFVERAKEVANVLAGVEYILLMEGITEINTLKENIMRAFSKMPYQSAIRLLRILRNFPYYTYAFSKVLVPAKVFRKGMDKVLRYAREKYIKEGADKYVGELIAEDVEEALENVSENLESIIVNRRKTWLEMIEESPYSSRLLDAINKVLNGEFDKEGRNAFGNLWDTIKQYTWVTDINGKRILCVWNKLNITAQAVATHVCPSCTDVIDGGSNAKYVVDEITKPYNDFGLSRGVGGVVVVYETANGKARIVARFRVMIVPELRRLVPTSGVYYISQYANVFGENKGYDFILKFLESFKQYLEKKTGEKWEVVDLREYEHRFYGDFIEVINKIVS